MKELWNKAREYGLVRLCTDAKGLYFCIIEFHTFKNISLEAKSGFDHLEPEIALEKAIINAQLIYENLTNELKQFNTIGKINGQSITTTSS